MQQGVQTDATYNIQQCWARLHVALYHKTQTGERLLLWNDKHWIFFKVRENLLNNILLQLTWLSEIKIRREMT